MNSALKREDLDGYLFSTTPTATAGHKPKKQTMPNARSQSPSNYNKANGQHLNRSNNKTREDLEELIEEIPFPQEDFSLTSISRSSNSNTPPSQKQSHSNQQANVFGTSENRKPPTQQSSAKSIPHKTLQYSNDRGGNNSKYNSASLQRPLHLDFGNNVVITEENLTGSDSLTPSHLNKLNNWSAHHVTPSSNSIFPQVVAPSIDISGEHSHSKLNFNQVDLSRSVNDNQNITIDNIHEKEITSAQKNERTSIRHLVDESKYKIQAKQFQEQKNNLENELNVQKKIYSKLEQENNYLCQRISELEEHLSLLQARDKGSLESIRGNNLQHARAQVKQVRGLLEKKEQKINELTIQIQKIQKNEQTFREAVDQELNNLHVDLQRSQILTQHHQQRAAELEQKFREEYQKKEMSTEALQQQSGQQSAQIARLNEELKQRELKSQKQENYIIEIEALLAQASSHLEEKEKEVERLKKSQETLLYDQHQTANLQIDKSWENKFYALEEELNKVKNLSQRQISSLKETISQQKDQMQVLEENLLKKEAAFQAPNGAQVNKNKSMSGLDAFLPQEDNGKVEEMRNQYEMEIAIYKAQVEELHRRLAQAELEGVDKSITQDSLPKGTSKLTISQSTACNLYLEPLHDIMVAFELYDTTCGFEDGLAKLSEYVQNLNETLQSQKKELFEAKKKEITLNSNLDYATNDAEHLRENNTKLQERENELLQKISSLHAEMAELKKTIVSLDSQLRIGQMNNSAKFSPSKCDISDIHGNDYYKEYLQLNEEYKSLQSDYNSSQEKVRRLEAQCQSLDFELKKSDAQLTRAREELELLQLQMKSQVMGNEKSHTEEVKKTLNERIRNLEQRNESLMDQLRDSEIALVEAREKIVLTENERNSLIKESSSSQEGIKRTLTDKVASLERKNKELVEELRNKQADLDSMRAEWQNLSIRYQSQTSSTEQDLATRDFKLTSQIEMMNRLEDENLRALKEINSLKEKLETRSLEIQRLMTEKNTLTLENDRLNLLLGQEKGANDKLRMLNENLALREQEIQDLKHQSILINEEFQRTRLLCAELEEREADSLKKVQQLTNTLREKQNELKFVLESARKKEEAEAHTSAELANKTKELEKSKNLVSQHEKSLEGLKNERNTLKKKADELESTLKKVQDEYKQKEDNLKQLEDKTEKNSKFLHEKDKKNVELFNVNKSLQENLKALEDTHNNLKADFEKKVKALTQKTGEVKNLTLNVRKLEEKNQELNQEILDLNIKIQQMENEVATMKVQKLKTNQMNTSQLNESTIAYPVCDKTQEENEFWEQTKRDFQKVLTEFAAKENEFDKIKQKFIEQIISLNEKISSLEKKCTHLTEENTYLNSQLALQAKSNSILNDKIKTLETSLNAIHYDSQDESDHEEPQNLGRRVSVKEYILKENTNILNKHNIIDEMRPPADYDTYNVKYTSNGHISEGTFKSNGSFAKATNVFTNNILDMISPEMLSAEDTVNLMVEVLRRANQSTKLANMLGHCEEFKTLTRSVKKIMTMENDYENTQQFDTMSTMSGRVRRQKIGGVSRSFVDQ